GRLGSLRFLDVVRLRVEPAGGENHWRSTNAGGGILIDHGWHVFYLMQWLMGGDAPDSVSGRLSLAPAREIEDMADLRLLFPGERLARAHLSWRSPARRTYTAIFGDKAMIEINGDQVVLTDRTGAVT